MITEKHFPLILVLLCSLLYLCDLGGRDFWAPVEPRYGEIVRVMFAKGGWIVPTVNGAIYTDKPMVFFWLALIAWNIAGIGFILSTYLFGRDFFSPRIGLIAAARLAAGDLGIPLG